MMQEGGLDVQTLLNQKFRAVLGPTRVPDSSVGKESAGNAGDPSSIPGSGRSTGEGIVFLGSPGGSNGKKNHLQCRRPGFNPSAGKIPWRRERLPTPVFWPGE